MSTNNSSIDVDVGAGNVRWNNVSIFSLIITVLSATSNSVVLFVVIFKKRLHTSFNIYVISLLTANVVYSFIGNVLDFVNNLWPVWWAGFPACTLYVYAIWTLVSCQVFMHFIISLNRFCAAAFPIHYRNNHTNVLAVSLSVGAWIAAHIITLPGIIIDAEKYRKPDLADGCQVDVTGNAGQKSWMICVQFSSCTVIGSIVLMYAFIMYKQVKRQRKIFTRSTVSSAPTESAPAVIVTKKLKANATILLAVITCSLVVFWGPAIIYYAIVPFQDELWSKDAEAVLTIVFNFQTVIDPVIFSLAVSEISEVIMRGLSGLNCFAKTGDVRQINCR